MDNTTSAQESLLLRTPYSKETFTKACEYDRDAINEVLNAILTDSRLLRINNGRRVIDDREYINSPLKWNSDEVALFMRIRATHFKRKIIVDNANETVFNLLCKYWCADAGFVDAAKLLGVPSPSLSKGILLAGNVGVGKTFLMRLFAHNQRFSYSVVNAKDLANTYQKQGIDAVEKHYKCTYDGRQLKIIKSGFDFDFSFDMLGLCIDDIGAEEKKNYMGNPLNVVEDIIENRYDKRQVGIVLHGTTNLTAEQLREYYGARVFSRLKQIVNLIVLPGNDRRADLNEVFDPYYKDKPGANEYAYDGL